MKILVSGSTGLVGSALVDTLKRKGHKVARLVRRKLKCDEPQIGWDIARGKLNPASLEGFDAVIHLAGENIAAGRWTSERKKRILESRTQGTSLLARTIAGLEHPPVTFICASAVGFYGSRGDQVLTEVSAPGQGFLADTCRAWEAAAQPAAASGIRVVNTRFGIVLSPNGGALKAMLPAFRLGVAGALGDGRQYMSWITLSDLIDGLIHVLEHPELRGPVNFTSPYPVTNAEFTRTMRQVVTFPLSPGKIWAPPLPAFAIQALLGEMGRELLLSSQRVLPVRLQETGFHFKYPEIKGALQAFT